MNQMEEALYRVGAHIVLKDVRPDPPSSLPPLKKMKIPYAPGISGDRKAKSNQRIIGGIPRDPVNRQAAIVTSKAPR